MINKLIVGIVVIIMLLLLEIRKIRVFSKMENCQVKFDVFTCMFDYNKLNMCEERCFDVLEVELGYIS